MEKLTEKNIVDYWLKEFPEFKKAPHFYEESRGTPYWLIGDFVIYVRDVLLRDMEENKKQIEQDPFILRLFSRLNDIFNGVIRADEYVLTLLHVECFEGFEESDTLKRVALSLLKDNALKEFKEMLDK